MPLPRVRFWLWQSAIVIALIAIALAFLRYLVAFLDSPFLGPDPNGEAAVAPVRFAIRAVVCGASARVLLSLWRWLRKREASLDDIQFLTAPDPPEPE